MKKQTLISFILLILVTGYFGRSFVTELFKSSSNNTQSQVIEQPRQSDYLFNQVSVKRFNSDGTIQSQLDAEKIEHFKASQVSKINQIKVVLTNADQNRWLLAAQSGLLNHQSQLLRLDKTVQIEQLNQTNADVTNTELTSTEQKSSKQNSQEFELSTADLMLNLQTKTAETNSVVTILSKETTSSTKSKTTPKQLSTSKTTTQAIGLVADFNTELFQLESKPLTQGFINQYDK